MKKIAVVTHDEVNQRGLQDQVEDRGHAFCPLSLRDPAPDGQYDGTLIDLDSLDPQGRRKLLSLLLADEVDGPVSLCSYNLEPGEETMLRRKGIAVFERLADAVVWLLGE
jgi:hypothetical protein